MLQKQNLPVSETKKKYCQLILFVFKIENVGIKLLSIKVHVPGDRGETIPYSDSGVQASLVSWNTSGNVTESKKRAKHKYQNQRHSYNNWKQTAFGTYTVNISLKR